MPRHEWRESEGIVRAFFITPGRLVRPRIAVKSSASHDCRYGFGRRRECANLATAWWVSRTFDENELLTTTTGHRGGGISQVLGPRGRNHQLCGRPSLVYAYLQYWRPNSPNGEARAQLGNLYYVTGRYVRAAVERRHSQSSAEEWTEQLQAVANAQGY